MDRLPALLFASTVPQLPIRTETPAMTSHLLIALALVALFAGGWAAEEPFGPRLDENDAESLVGEWIIEVRTCSVLPAGAARDIGRAAA